jgi:hypothetical protein
MLRDPQIAPRNSDGFGGDVRFRKNSGKHLLALSFSGFDPKETFGGLANLVAGRAI